MLRYAIVVTQVARNRDLELVLVRNALPPLARGLQAATTAGESALYAGVTQATTSSPGNWLARLQHWIRERLRG